MAAATITSRAGGYSATGGVDATAVTASRTCVSTIIITSGSAAAGSAIVQTGTTAAAVAYAIFNSATASRSASYVVDAALDGIVVTLSATDVVAVFNVA